MVDVYDKYASDYYQEKRVADKIIMTLDQSVYLNDADDCDDEMLLVDLKFEDLVFLCNILQARYEDLKENDLSL